MRGIGWTLIVAGFVLIAWGWLSPTSIHSPMEYVPGVGLQEAKDVLNIGLLQTQLMLVQCGLAAIVAGTVAVCVGELIEALVRGESAKHAPPIDLGTAQAQ